MIGENTVPLGVAGTGAAYILPASQSINNFGPIMDYQAQQQAAQQAAAEAQAQKLAAQMQKNRLDIKGGRLWQSDLNTMAKTSMDMGTKLYTSGYDPSKYYNDPNVQSQVDAHNDYRNKVVQAATLRDDLTKQADVNDKLISAQPQGYYDQDSINAQHAFFAKPLSEIQDKGLQLPPLQRAFNLGDAVAKLKTSPVEVTKQVGNQKIHTVAPDDDKHLNTATQFFQTNPEAQRYAEKQIGIPLSQLPSTSDPNELMSQLDDYYRSNVKDTNGVTTAQQLVNAGVPSYDSPQYNKFINDQATTLSQGRKRFDGLVNGVKTNLDNQVHTVNDKLWDFNYANYKMSKERLGMEAERFDQWKKDQQEEDSEPSYNVPGYVSQQGKIADSQTTSPMVIDAGDLKGSVVPKEVFNTSTGHFGGNADTRDIKDAKIKITPMAVYTDKQGREIKMMLTDDQINQAKDGTLKINGNNISYANVKYPYMVYGTETKNQPIKNPDGTVQKDANENVKSKKVSESVAFPLEGLSNDKFTKRFDKDKLETKLDFNTQIKILHDRIKDKYPDLSDQELQQATADLYKARMEKYSN